MAAAEPHISGLGVAQASKPKSIPGRLRKQAFIRRMFVGLGKAEYRFFEPNPHARFSTGFSLSSWAQWDFIFHQQPGQTKHSDKAGLLTGAAELATDRLVTT